MTHDGLLPKKLAKVHKKRHTPHIATAIIAIVLISLVTIFPVDKLVQAASFGFLSSFMAVCLSTIILRYKKPDLPKEFKCPLMPFIPIAGIVLFAVVLCGLSKMTFILASGWIVFLLLVYVFYSSKHALCGCNEKINASK
jgi:APA family basic amino acid/polyamine antiporter